MSDVKSFDYAESNMLCTEGPKSLCFDDDDLVDGQSCEIKNDEGLSVGNGGSDSEPLINFPCLSEDNFGLMLDREKGFLPKDDYLKRLRNGDLNLSVRTEALDWISKARAHHSFGALCLCLSMNYCDRFLSVYDLPQGKPWVVRLIAVSCLSLAAKMEEIEVPLSVDLQVGEPKFMFESKTVQRMELFVLSTLKWKMRAYTPCSFIDYFLHKIKKDEFPTMHLIHRSTEVIISTITCIDLLEFRPSEIAAAVAMSVSVQATDMDEALPSFMGVDKVVSINLSLR
ncbi:cyclin-D4-1-like [Olea europaea subsp. europaea]|uniref:Cyclin-D4-1-like n=1 Tax=Olea europaea subsp. europaea TaxID=158383 RepID=A0A8S0Q569_OLEEU|nr:cyclin-D4-1-like [Olea europaea subsp. europaea]